MKVAGHRGMVVPPMNFHRIIDLPDEYWVFDFTKGPQSDFENPFEYSIGKYDESRPGMYTAPLFGGVRNHHVGLDIGAPVDTPVYAFSDGTVYAFADNAEEGSYGPTIITQHTVALPEEVGSNVPSLPQTVWVLHGHLSRTSLEGLAVGQSFRAGERIAWIGGEHENGGWAPHIHLQLSVQEPESHDLPGVVHEQERSDALLLYPDPRLIVGPVY